ncbi:MAG TPA: type 2 isopentenyl-diphosphate Delta-isomerase [Candidatus Eisenbacteria bacterium]|nr:type 2 isopentenyl-diphosphate Delta-isomerase [Candidatus Eisenbacteria bacterium]
MDEVERRKGEHLRIAAGGGVEAAVDPGWQDVHLVHSALPAADLDAIDLSIGFLGRRLRAPLVIAAMTGGHPAAREVNRCLAAAAERHGLAMGLGSQRAALRRPELAPTYAVAREAAPTAFLIANVGVAQLIPQASGDVIDDNGIRTAVEMIDANALAIHLNFLEEVVQTEGDRRAAGVREALRAAVATSPVPAVAKETGAGISREIAFDLAGLGFSALDVGGAGGTSFAAVEARRAAERGDRRGARLGDAFRDWGLPTVVSLVGAAAAGLPVIATGGVRSGLDAAKALALGATIVSVGRPLLTAAMAGDRAVDEWIEHFLEEIRGAVFLSGGRSCRDLRGVARVVGGETRRWLDDLGYRDAARSR